MAHLIALESMFTTNRCIAYTQQLVEDHFEVSVDTKNKVVDWPFLVTASNCHQRVVESLKRLYFLRHGTAPLSVTGHSLPVDVKGVGEKVEI